MFPKFDHETILEILIINKVINENPNSVKDYKEGKDRAVKYLMGQVMKESKGKINPKDAMDKLISNLNNI